MKKMFFSVRSTAMTMFGFVAITALISACSKFKDDNNTNAPAAGLMTFNLATDQPAIGVALSGNNLLSSPLAYTNYSGTYQLIFPGNREVESFNVTSDSSFAKNSFTFDADKYYSLFVTGDNGNYRNIITRDNFDSLSKTSTKAHIRYVNAIADSTDPVVTIAANGTNVFNGAASFNDVSDFKIIDAGNVSVGVNNGTTINATRNITVEEGKVYTVLLVGKPGASDSTKNVQIKYIANGSLSTNQ